MIVKQLPKDFYKLFVKYSKESFERIFKTWKMKENQKYSRNFNNFTSKGERLGVFGVVNGNNLHILTNKCSKKDQFSKKLSKKIVESYLSGNYTQKDSKTFIVNIDRKDYKLYYNNTLKVGNDRPSWLLNQYCIQNFYQYLEQLTTHKVLVKNLSNVR